MCLVSGVVFSQDAGVVINPIYNQELGIATEISSRLSIKDELRVLDAEFALDNGATSLALSIATDCLSKVNLTKEEKERAFFVCSVASLERNDFINAKKYALLISERLDEVDLIETFVLINQKDFLGARKIFSKILLERIDIRFVPWYHIAKMLIAKYDGDIELSAKAYKDAMNSAKEETLRDHILYLWAISSLSVGKIDSETIEKLHDAFLEKEETEQGAILGKTLIYALLKKGQKDEAVKILNSIKNIPESLQAEYFLIEFFLMNENSSLASKELLKKVICLRPSREIQNIAMNLFVVSIEKKYQAGNQDALILEANDIDRFLAGEEPFSKNYVWENDSRVLDLELYTRIRIAEIIKNKNLERKLLDQFLKECTASPYLPNILRRLIRLSIDQKEYRRATVFLTQLKEISKNEDFILQVDIFIADLHFLNGDYALASKVYEKINVLKCSKEKAGQIFFQRVLCEIRDNRINDALDLLNKVSEFNVDDIWRQRAMYILLNAMQDSGQGETALNLANRLLKEPTLPIDLKIRVLWVKVRIALLQNNAKEVEKNADILLAIIEKDLPVNYYLNVSLEETKARILLAKISASLAVEESEKNVLNLKDLREKYPNTKAAVLSYLEEARALSYKGRHELSLQCYESMINKFAENEVYSKIIVLAYFEASQEALTLGRQKDAVRLLDNIAEKYPTDGLAFIARLRQANIFRYLNDFDSALSIYDSLIVGYPNHKDLRIVEIGRADCLLAIASRTELDPASIAARKSALDKALSAYERLYSLPENSMALRAEAGYKWAYALEQYPQVFDMKSVENIKYYREESRKIYWKVISDVLSKKEWNDKDKLSEIDGGYWISRCFFSVAELYEKDKMYDDARRIYSDIINWSKQGKISGQELAQIKLKQIINK